ncbi:hypothetical protein SAMN04487769_0274 [Burkholderia sp. b14]|nr:hypothetical protein SAMN04487769_0274 [Burkholderia sp. b14]SIT80994.1 hypothetical protein SAMN04487768_0564 [Burkholderia sp. b13]
MNRGGRLGNDGMKVRNRSVPAGGERRTDSMGGTLAHVRHGRAQHASTQHSRPWGQLQRSLSCACCGRAVACVAYAVARAATRAPWVRTAGVAPGANAGTSVFLTWWLLYAYDSDGIAVAICRDGDESVPAGCYA